MQKKEHQTERKKKFKFRRSEVPYIGHLLTADRLRVNPERARAVRDMPRPVDVKGIQRFLGMVNYLSIFFSQNSVRASETVRSCFTPEGGESCLW